MSLVETNKVKVKKGNTIFRVYPDEVKKYFQMGFDVYGSDGKISKRALPTDIPSLQKAFFEHEATIEKLKERIAELEEKRSTQKRPVEFEDTNDEDENEVEPVRSKRKRRREREVDE